MSNHVFHEIYIHITWHTKNGIPLLKGVTGKSVCNFIRRRCANKKGVFLHAIGGTDDHLHLAMNIEPYVCISDLIGDLKGSSSCEIDKREKKQVLSWQRGFGIVSFGIKNMQFVIEYIEKQREHHAKGTTHNKLESTGEENRTAEYTYG